MRKILILANLSFIILISPVKGTDNNIVADSCSPSFSEIYDFEVGSMFQYQEISGSSAGSQNPTSDITYQYIVRNKTVDGNQIKYLIEGWKQELQYNNSNSDIREEVDTVRIISSFDEELVFIDSISNFLNQCPKEIVPLNHSVFLDYGFTNLYSRIQTVYNDSTLIKTIGGQNNILHYNQYDSLVPNQDLYYRASYEKGLGLTSYEFQFFEVWESKELNAYFIGQDTVGTFVDIADDKSWIYGAATRQVNNKINEELILYPNPTSGSIKINSKSPTSIGIYNINGQLLISEIVSDQTVDITELKTGYYIVKLFPKNGKVISSKLIVY